MEKNIGFYLQEKQNFIIKKKGHTKLTTWKKQFKYFRVLNEI